MSRPLSIFLHSAEYDRTYQAVNMARTALAMGRRVHLFLLYGALASFVAGTWDDVETIRGGDDREPGGQGKKAPATGWIDGMRRRFELSDTPSLYDLLEKARAGGGGVRVYACSASARFAGLAPRDLLGRVDDIVGLSTMLEISEQSESFYI